MSVILSSLVGFSDIVEHPRINSINKGKMYNEAQLIDKLKHGDHTAFHQLFDYYKKRIYAFLYTILRSHDEAEELLQEVFIKIWENRMKLDENLSLNSYIYKIAQNRALNQLRKKTYQVLLEKELLAQTDNIDHGFESSLINKDLDKYINSLIDKIPSRCREVFLLKYRKNMTYKEIAEIMSISENTVDTQLRKAIKFLRKEIGEDKFIIPLFFTMLQI